jgi:hypothetical protein
MTGCQRNQQSFGMIFLWAFRGRLLGVGSGGAEVPAAGAGVKVAFRLLSP